MLCSERNFYDALLLMCKSDEKLRVNMELGFYLHLDRAGIALDPPNCLQLAVAAERWATDMQTY